MKGCGVFLVSCALAFFGWSSAVPASVITERASDDFTEIPATDRDDIVPVLDVDLGTRVPVYILQDQFVAYSGQRFSTYTGHCLSENDPDAGACPVGYQPGNPTLVTIRFVEQRSGLSVDLTARAVRTESDIDGARTFGISEAPETYTWLTTLSYSIWLTPEEIAKLPIGGIWTGRLVLRSIPSSKPISNEAVIAPIATGVDWRMPITLRVVDRSNIQLYIPEFGASTPVVDLGLRGLPHAGGPGIDITGHRVLDTCLYDGFNNLSEWFELTVSDPASVDKRFRVRHELSTGQGANEEVVYDVVAPDPVTGVAQAFESGVAYRFQGADHAAWRYVRMPFSATPVVCTPWPITLDTLIRAADVKRTGHYTGTLRIEFRTPGSQP